MQLRLSKMTHAAAATMIAKHDRGACSNIYDLHRRRGCETAVRRGARNESASPLANNSYAGPAADNSYEGYHEWRPRRPAAAAICVVTLVTGDLMVPTSWASDALEISINWALAHGYTFAVFDERYRFSTASLQPLRLHADSSPAAHFWRKPLALLEMLRKPREAGGAREPMCGLVLLLDADVRPPLPPLLQAHARRRLRLPT